MPPDDPNSNRLMRCVDGMQGADWDQYGHIPAVEPVGWHASLPIDEDGQISLTLKDAVRVARIHSRDYQDNLETLYLSALDVTFERFQFDHQFFADGRIEQDFRGRDVGAQSNTSHTNSVGFSKLSATGAQLVAGLANSLVWDAWGSGGNLFSSTLDFSIVQPLLRFGGRARVLENLTQSERRLLANVRQMQQFRQGFYVNIATGRNSGSGPTLGNNVGQAGLGLIAGLPSGRNGAPGAGGYLDLLQTQQQIRNQTTNIAALRSSLELLDAAFGANRISFRLQVDQARQALLNAQSSLLAAKASYASRVDAFKIELGLPPELPLEIKDDVLNRFVLIDPKLNQIQDELSEILIRIRKRRDDPSFEFVDDALEAIADLDDDIESHLSDAGADMDSFLEKLPQRKSQLERVAKQIKRLSADVDQRAYDQQVLTGQVEMLESRLPKLESDLAENRDLRLELIERKNDDDSEMDLELEPDSESKKKESSPEKKEWEQLIDLATKLSDLLLELSLVQAEIRLQGIGLLPVQIESEEAVEVARVQRLDWMNARANLVDQWRRIEFFANALKSDLSLSVNGSVGTSSNNLLGFNKDSGQLQFGLQYDSPLVRVAERNQYRNALIEYQQARRDYMLFEDRIKQSLQNTIRIIQLSQINLEIRRAAVQVAIAQVDIARLRLNPPAQQNQTTSRTSPTAARDLVSALSDLLDAQNDLLEVWVSYEVLRVLLDFEMGTFELDPDGSWIDPGSIGADSPKL